MFIKARVLYTISTKQFDSNTIFDDLKSSKLIESYFPDRRFLDQDLAIFLNTLPDSTIFAKKIKHTPEDPNSYFIALPFFSSHIKIPLKVGEYVWIYNHKTRKRNNQKFKEINSYWFSRVHGLNYTEDVSYSYNDRDILLLENSKQNLDFFMRQNTPAKQKRDAKEFFEVNKDNKIQPSTSLGDKTFELNRDEKLSVMQKARTYLKSVVPRQTKQDKDLLLQGSDNAMIKLTSDSISSKDNTSTGEIQITSGVGSYFEDDYQKITSFFYDIQGNVIKNYKFDLFLSRSTQMPDKIVYENQVYSYLNRNIFEPYENNPELKAVKSNEGNFDILHNASTIIVSEQTNYLSAFRKNNNSLTNISFLEEGYVLNDLPSNLRDIEGRKDAKFNVVHAIKMPSASERVETNKPSINIASSNINIFSRNDNSSINIIKEYKKSYGEGDANAYFTINKFGDAYIDANRIFIGSHAHFVLKNQNASDENIKPIIHLGESNKSQSLVLGNQLKEYLAEMLDVSREDMHQTKDLFLRTQDTIKNINSTLTSEFDLSLNNFLTSLAGSSSTNIGTINAAPAPLAGAQVGAAISLLYKDITNLCTNLQNAMLNFSFEASKLEDELLQAINSKLLKREEELSLRLENIENNIDKILSKICKTS